MKANPKKEWFFLSLVREGTLVVRPDGTVLNAKTLKVYDKRSINGHIQIGVKVHGKVQHILAGRLVYLALVGSLTPDDEVIHDNGVRWDNRPSNLIKTDARGNIAHAYASGRHSGRKVSLGLHDFYHRNGRLQHNAKLSPRQVNEVRNRFAAGASKKQLARDYEIDRKAIIKILRGTAYRSALPAQFENPTAPT